MAGHPDALRVLFVTPRFAPAIGGVEWHTQMLANELRRQGVSIDVSCTDPTARESHLGSVDGLTVRRFPTLRGDSTFLVSPTLARWVARHARAYDIVHAHSYHTPIPLLSAVATRRARVPLVVTPYFHGTGHTPLRRLLHVPYRYAGAWALRRAEAVICLSDAERRLLEQQFEVPTTTVMTIPVGLDIDEIAAAEPIERPPNRVTVLAVGRLERYKGAARVIQAAGLLPPHMDVVVIGDGPDRADVVAAAARSGMGERLQLPGRVERSELLGWYRSADVFVTMSEHESFGITLLEAAAAGARAVASDIPAHREVAQFFPHGVVELVDRDASSSQIADAVVRAAALGRTPDPAATVPTWREVASRTLEVYRRLARPRRA
jgi:glycosyltransferase involved in cell wall biosynthesis